MNGKTVHTRLHIQNRWKFQKTQRTKKKSILKFELKWPWNCLFGLAKHEWLINSLKWNIKQTNVLFAFNPTFTSNNEVNSTMTIIHNNERQTKKKKQLDIIRWKENNANYKIKSTNIFFFFKLKKAFVHRIFLLSESLEKKNEWNVYINNSVCLFSFVLGL